jgi:hypothetical protein
MFICIPTLFTAGIIDEGINIVVVYKDMKGNNIRNVHVLNT